MFLGNLLGSVLYAVLLVIALTNAGQVEPSGIAARIVQIAEAKTLGYAHFGAAGMLTVFVKAMLCNWMVCLGVVMAMSSTSTIGRIAAAWMPILVFFAQGFEHSVVNMFVIPAGMLMGAKISLADWWIWNQIPVTLGNLVGGLVFTGLGLYVTYGRQPAEPVAAIRGAKSRAGALMDDAAFSPEQQEYLKGFMAGVEARRGALGLPAAPTGDAAPSDPNNLQRAAQDRTIAAGGKLTAEEEAKRKKHPLDRFDEISALAAEGKFPRGTDVFLTKFHGLFYVAPAQDAFMCRLRIPGGILTAHQARGIAAIADELAGGYADITTRANLQLREIPAANAPEILTRLADIGLTSRGAGADNIRNITGDPTAGIDPRS